MSHQLIAIGFSPWSLKARWALDHHDVDYRYTEYIPMVGEPWLRLKIKRWRGPVSVPVLITPGRALTESFDIARFAESHGRRRADTLFPAGKDDDIATWAGRSDALLSAGRVLIVRASLRTPDAIRELLPPPLRKLPGALALGRAGSRYVLKKYPVAGSDDELIADMRERLIELREALGDDEYLCGQFSYADIVMAIGLQGVKPPDAVPLGPANRQMWTRDALASEFADLLAWRDRIYQRHYAR